ncbi:uncharacterized protein LOC123876045 [Maniola jurtina]|uniref:uncharacterized protein LOC123876045 n=1 Tax=Maniola jurtina TaxID=191418 RepID=UPI001E68AEF2|nr:uncharacterized protein LOC123876045 [Maniola jurtina]
MSHWSHIFSFTLVTLSIDKLLTFVIIRGTIVTADSDRNFHCVCELTWPRSNMTRPKPKKRNRRKIGARPYKNYSEEMLLLAVEMFLTKKVSSYDAEKQFGIPRRTIEKRAKNLHTSKPGPRYRFTEEEESQFVKVLIVASEFGCPLTQLDFRMIVFDYLKKKNKAYIFNDNPPGDWWVKNFLIRHHDKLTVRSTQNIKKARAEKSLQDFQIYFENLKSCVKDLPATHILNYDETNVSDDPGAVKCIFRRGIKYPERTVNYSKGCISVMFSGTASGDLLAPYIVYKSENMWTQWCDGGPEGARYNRTKSGWFDSAIFIDWFTTIVIPWAKSLEGPKLVIGDNLSSHINLEVIELCERYNIRFVLLPPNSTHITQPLDVAFFAPLKRTWRKILMKYKIENPKQTSLNKMHFPLLLKQLIQDGNLNNADNLISGFRATGIFPYNPQKVYSKIPEYCEEITHDIDKSLLDYLKENRNPNPIRRIKGNKKMNVAAGKSVTSSDINKDVTKKNKLNSTSELTIKTNFAANSGEQVVGNKLPEKKRPKITILSEIIIPPKADGNQKSQTTKNEQRKARTSDFTTKSEEPKAGPSGFMIKSKEQRISNKDVKKRGIRTKRLHDDSTDSDSECSIQYADSSDYDFNEDMQDYLLKQLIEDQKMKEQEIEEQITELETNVHGTESLRKRNYERNGKEMVNEYEIEQDAWEKQELEEQMSELDTKGTETESLKTEINEMGGQKIEQKVVNKYEIKQDARNKQEIDQEINTLETEGHETKSLRIGSIKGNETLLEERQKMTQTGQTKPKVYILDNTYW